MRTAVSVPDDVFPKAERLAKREGRSRSQACSAALREYVTRLLTLDRAALSEPVGRS